MNTKKALTDAQIAEVRRLYAGGATSKFLAAEYGVSTVTISKYVKGVQRSIRKSESDIPDVSFGEPDPMLAVHASGAVPETAAAPEPAEAHEPEILPELEEPRPESSELYEIARGIEIFVKKHISGDFNISISSNGGTVVITAAAGDEEIKLTKLGNKLYSVFEPEDGGPPVICEDKIIGERIAFDGGIVDKKLIGEIFFFDRAEAEEKLKSLAAANKVKAGVS